MSRDSTVVSDYMDPEDLEQANRNIAELKEQIAGIEINLIERNPEDASAHATLREKIIKIKKFYLNKALLQGEDKPELEKLSYKDMAFRAILTELNQLHRRPTRETPGEIEYDEIVEQGIPFRIQDADPDLTVSFAGGKKRCHTRRKRRRGKKCKSKSKRRRRTRSFRRHK